MTGKISGARIRFMGILPLAILIATLAPAAAEEGNGSSPMEPNAVMRRGRAALFQLNVIVEGVRVSLAWDAMENAESYNLYYAPHPIPPDYNIQCAPLGNRTTLSIDLFDGASYHAAVEAVNSSGSMGYSNVAAVIVQLEPPADLTAFESDDALEAYLKRGLKENAGPHEFYHLPVTVLFSPAVSHAAAEEATHDSTLLFTPTNLRAPGVDEADHVKTDGRYLYRVPYRHMWPFPHSSSPTAPPEIVIHQLSDNPPGSAEVGVISLENAQSHVSGLYLLTDREGDKPDLLITVGARAWTDWDLAYNHWSWTFGITEVGLYNVNAPLHAEAAGRITLDGRLLASRRIGEVLYVVTRHSPVLDGFHPGFDSQPENQKKLAEYETAVEAAELPDLLPSYSLNGESRGLLVQSRRCFLAYYKPNVTPEPSLITISAIHLSDPGNPVSQTITGPMEAMFLAGEVLYLATTRYDYEAPRRHPSLLDGPAAGSDPWTPPPESTDLHKFILAADGPEYRGSGTAPGHLGWEKKYKARRMDHINGALRVATSPGCDWSGARTRLTLLREYPDPSRDVLREFASIEVGGEEGEEFHSVRFPGDLVYITMFRPDVHQYIIDLSDPGNPVAKGSRLGDGCDKYIYPVGNDLMLGLGCHPEPGESSDETGPGETWSPGLKLSLFDVSDPSAPRVVDSIMFGRRPSRSYAQTDHHAISFLPSKNGEPARFALPIVLQDSDSHWFTPNDPASHHGWTHNGLYLLKIHTGESGGPARIEKLGQIITESDEAGDISHPHKFADMGCQCDRIVLLNNSVHYFHFDELFSTPWGDGDYYRPTFRGN